MGVASGGVGSVGVGSVGVGSVGVVSGAVASGGAASGDVAAVGGAGVLDGAVGFCTGTSVDGSSLGVGDGSTSSATNTARLADTGGTIADMSEVDRVHEVRQSSRRVDLHADVQSRAGIEIDVARRVVRVHGVVDLAQLESVLAMVARC